MTRQHFAVDQFVGRSAWTERIRRRVVQIANYNYGVLVTGPSGTGKELVARAVHTHSSRSDSPFIPVNCAAVPKELFSSQLFGHTKGAFTGAHYASLGCFRAADGGTIFLDEIGELDLDNQAKLLRVLQEKKVTPVGGHDGVDVNVRTVAATNRNLAEEVRAGRFRLDLFYRLNVLSVETVGLADRVDDIQPLANHFLAKTAVECGLPLKSLTPEALRALNAYHWPGNVRELENFIERAVVLSESEEIGPDAFPEVLEANFGNSSRSISAPLAGGFIPETEPQPMEPDRLLRTDHEAILPPTPQAMPPAEPLPSHDNWPSLADVERTHIVKTLRETFYNQSAAARMLGVDRKLLARKIKKYKIELPKKRNTQKTHTSPNT